jgi:pyruvate-formate lyase-activating enzyme
MAERARPLRKGLPIVAAGPASAFVRIPGLLLLRLMSRCNERCEFCMVEGEIRASDDVDFAEAHRRIIELPAGDHVEFFGGEPTIYPRFLDLLTAARAHGHPCSIATNARIFHSAAYCDRVAALDPRHIYIRTSLLGDTEELHDNYARAPGSYAQTMRGMANLVSRGFLTQVNVVMLSGNVDRLPECVRLVAGLGVPRIKFGSLIGATAYPHLSVPLSELKPRLNEAITLAESLGLVVTVEKTPVCAVEGRLDLISTERKLSSWRREFDDAGACGGCLVRRWCDGLDPDHVQLHGLAGLRRVTALPRRAVAATVPADPEALKTCVVELPEPVTDTTRTALTRLIGRVERQHAELALIPSRLIT